MLLAVDLGNSNIKFGLFSGSQLLHTLRAETRHEQSADEYASSLSELASAHGIAPKEVDRAVIGSVVPALTPVLASAIQAAFGCTALVIARGSDGDIPMRVDRPAEVGADRMLNAIAAHALVLGEAGAAPSIGSRERGVIVVDLGTATKLDCVSPRGEFLGGVIAPGVEISLDALAQRGAQLRHVELAAPPSAVGRNTTQCIQSGVIYGHAALVDGLVARLASELPFEVDVVATGGLSSLIAPHTQSLRRLEPDLTLHGLRVLHDRMNSVASSAG
jgi:type III pantothenate kinase